MIGILNKNKKSKKAWIRIVEAFISLLLITGALLVVIDQGYIGRSDISEQVYQVQLAILREIELNSDYRTQILKVDNKSLPIKWGEFPDYNLEEIQGKVNITTPDYLNCIAKICKLDNLCQYIDANNLDQDIYAQAVAITAEGDTYSPRQLKMFCWSD